MHNVLPIIKDYAGPPTYRPRPIRPTPYELAGAMLAMDIAGKKTLLNKSIQMYGGLKNYRSNYRSAPKKAPTNRKNVGSKGGPKKAPNRRVPVNKKTLQKQINQLAKKVSLDKSTHTHRYAESSTVVALIAQCDHTENYPVSNTKLEAYTDNLRFYDSSTNTLVNVDPTSLTASHDIRFKNIHSKIYIKNSYHVPARIKVYLCTNKVDTNGSVLDAYTAGLADQCTTAGADTESILMYLNDIERVKEQFSLDCVVDKTLLSGDHCTAFHNTGPFNYDPSTIDTLALYMRQHKHFMWVIRIEADLCHDSAQAEIGRGNAKVDYEVQNKAEIEYNSGGLQLNDYSFNDQRNQSFTNSALTGCRQVPNNEILTTT